MKENNSVESFGQCFSETLIRSNCSRTRYTDLQKSFSAARREAGITNFTFHDLRHTFGTRLPDAGVDVVKIKELMGHASIVTTMRYIHATDQGKRGAITVLSEYRQQRSRKDGHKLVTNEKRQAQ